MLFSQAALGRIPNGVPMGALWPFKHTEKQLDLLETGDMYTFSSQYLQNPSPIGGSMFKEKYFKYYDVLPADANLYMIFGDTAQKIKEHNDFSVFQCWARSPSRGLFLVDQIRGKWEAPELESRMVSFWNKHKPAMDKRGAQCVYIEDKSSGSSLIQSIKRNYLIPIEAIQRNIDKVLRAMGVVKYFAAGYIHLPKDADWVCDYVSEFSKFNALMTHLHDDQIDPTMDAVEKMLVFGDHIDMGDIRLEEDMNKINEFNWDLA